VVIRGHRRTRLSSRVDGMLHQRSSVVIRGHVRVSAAAWMACCSCDDSRRHFANFSLGIALSSHAFEMHL